MEAAARRMSFCMPFNNLDMDVAFVLPEQLRAYRQHNHLGEALRNNLHSAHSVISGHGVHWPALRHAT